MGNIEGTLRVVRFDDESGYSAVFVPDHRGGGALPQLRLPTRESLRAFLVEIGFSEAAAQETIAELATTNAVSRHTAAPVELLRRYELLQLGVAESILRYLSV